MYLKTFSTRYSKSITETNTGGIEQKNVHRKSISSFIDHHHQEKIKIPIKVLI